MKSYIKYFFIFGVLFSLFFLGSLRVGPLTVRNYASVLLLVVAVFLPRQHIRDKVVNCYVAYLLTFLLCNLANGNAASPHFIRIVMGFLFPSIVSLYAFPKLITSQKDLHFVIASLVVLYVINAAVTYAQYAGSPIAWAITDRLGFVMPDETNSYTLGSFLPGLTGDVVNNGYLLACLVPIVSIGIYSNKKLYKLLGYFMLFASSLVMFYVQQRMAFLAVVLYAVFLAVIKKDKILKGSAFVLVLLFLVGIDTSNMDFGRISLETSNDDRARLFSCFLNFIESKHVLFGNYEIYLKDYGGIQHNAFTGVITLGGITLFIVFCILTYKCVVRLWRIIKNSINEFPIAVCLSVACFIYIGYEQTHSAGMHNEGLLFWVSYGILLAHERLKSNPD